jgi:hypothetical protein
MIDLLHIDTEGHDAVILDQVDFDRILPDVVLYESKHLSAEDRRRCQGRLRASGYPLHVYHSDTLAIRAT